MLQEGQLQQFESYCEKLYTSPDASEHVSSVGQRRPSGWLAGRGWNGACGSLRRTRRCVEPPERLLPDA